MPFPLLRSANSGAETGNTTSHTVNLPPTIESGDLLLVFMAFDGNPTVTWDNSSHGTWPTILNTANGSACRLIIAAKVAAGTEDSGTLTISTGSSSEQSVHRSICIRQWEGTLAGGLNLPTAATGTTANPDPPVATDSWGTVPRKTISVCGYDFSRTVTVYPSGYALNQFNDVSGGGSGCGLGSAGRNATEGVQNPGQFTLDNSDQWVAATVSVKGIPRSDARLQGSDRQLIVRSNNVSYFVDHNTSGDIRIYKGNAVPPTSFAEQDSSNNPSNTRYYAPSAAPYLGLSSDTTGERLNILYYDSNAESGVLREVNFIQSSDTFSTDQSLDDVGGADPNFPYTTVFADRQGNVHGAYVESVSSLDLIRYSNEIGDATWKASIDIDTGNNFCFPAMAFDENNIPVIAYINADLADLKIGVGNVTNATSFTPSTLDTDVSTDTTVQKVSILQVGTVTWVACVDSDNSIIAYQDATARDTGSVGKSPSLFQFQDGNVGVLYIDSNDDVVYRRWNGSSWDSAEILETGTYNWVTAPFPHQIVDHYNNGSNDGNGFGIRSTGSDIQGGMSFTGNGTAIIKIRLFVHNFSVGGSETSTCRIWTHSGTFGTSSIPTGSALATSNAVNISSHVASATTGWIEYEFATPFQTVNGTNYVFSVDCTDSATSLSPKVDNTSPTHGGNSSRYNGSSWSADTTRDFIFKIYGIPAPQYLFEDGSNVVDWGAINTNTVTTQTQTGISRITASTTRTQTGISRIEVTSTQTQTGISALIQTTQQEQDGISRITASTSRTQDGVSRLTNTDSQTQDGISRIGIVSTQTHDGISRIESTALATQDGVTRITATSQQTQDGISRVTATSSQTQDGISRIEDTSAQTQDGVSRLEGTSTQTQDGMSRVTVTSTEIQTGISSIQTITTTPQTQTGISRIEITSVETQDGISRIEATASEIQTGISAIHNTTVQTQDGISAIENTTTQTQDGISRIEIDSIQTQDGISRLEITSASTQDGISRIETTSSDTQEGISKITNSTLQTQLGISAIHNTTSQTQDGVSRIEVHTVETQDGVSRIEITVAETQDGISRIQTSAIETQTGISSIHNTTVQTQDGIAAISNAIIQTQSGISRIQVTFVDTQEGISRIQVTNTDTQDGISRIETSSAQTQTGISSIEATTQQTQDGISTIENTTVQTQDGVSRLEVTSVQPQSGISRIEISTSQDQSGISRLTVVVVQTQGGLATIHNTTVQTQEGISTITGGVQQTQSGIANILNSTARTQDGISRIEITSQEDQLGQSRITSEQEVTQPGISRITVISTQTQDGISRITASSIQTQDGVSSIHSTTVQTIDGISSIVGGTVQTQEGISRIQSTEAQTQSGLSRISITSMATQDAVSRITLKSSADIVGIANIYGTTARTIDGDTSILNTSQVTQSGISQIVVSGSSSQTQDGISRIEKTIAFTQLGISSIQQSTERTSTGKSRIVNGYTAFQTTGGSSVTSTNPVEINGNLYAAVSEIKAGMVNWHIIKSTDLGITWTTVDTSTVSTNFGFDFINSSYGDSDIHVNGDYGYIVTSPSTGHSVSVRRFNHTTDSIDTGYSVNSSDIDFTFESLWASNGDLYIIGLETHSITHQKPVFNRLAAGSGTWDSILDLDPTPSGLQSVISITEDLSGRIHFIYSSAPSAGSMTLYHRSWNGSVLSSETTIASTTVDQTYYPISNGVSYLRGGVNKVGFLNVNATTDDIEWVEGDAEESPTFSTSTVSTSNPISGGNMSVAKDDAEWVYITANIEGVITVFTDQGQGNWIEFAQLDSINTTNLYSAVHSNRNKLGVFYPINGSSGHRVSLLYQEIPVSDRVYAIQTGISAVRGTSKANQTGISRIGGRRVIIIS